MVWSELWLFSFYRIYGFLYRCIGLWIIFIRGILICLRLAIIMILDLFTIIFIYLLLMIVLRDYAWIIWLIVTYFIGLSRPMTDRFILDGFIFLTKIPIIFNVPNFFLFNLRLTSLLVWFFVRKNCILETVDAIRIAY